MGSNVWSNVRLLRSPWIYSKFQYSLLQAQLIEVFYVYFLSTQTQNPDTKTQLIMTEFDMSENLL